MDFLFASGSKSSAQLQADAAAYGVLIEPHHLAPREYRLWAEHWPAVDLFSRLQTQWRATSGGLVGLDYGVLMALAPVWGVTVTRPVMDALQVMEVHAREILNQRARR